MHAHFAVQTNLHIRSDSHIRTDSHILITLERTCVEDIVCEKQFYCSFFQGSLIRDVSATAAQQTMCSTNTQ